MQGSWTTIKRLKDDEIETLTIAMKMYGSSLDERRAVATITGDAEEIKELRARTITHGNLLMELEQSRTVIFES